MKAILLISTAIIASTGLTANAQFQHRINLYADAGHTTTSAFDESPGTLTIYVVHEAEMPNGHGVSAAFSIRASDGFTGVFLSETTPFQFTGNSSSGIAIAYPCSALPIQVLEVTYSVFGTSEPCSNLRAIAHPDYDFFGGVPVVIDCDFDPAHPASGGVLAINPEETCSPLPIEPTTWGKVKALYR